MAQIEFTIDDIVRHRNRFAEINGRMLPKTGNGAEFRDGICNKCGKDCGVYATCSGCREAGTVKRILKQLVSEGEIERVTDGRGVKGGAQYRMKKKIPHVREHPKVGRNHPCSCGSGIKYKRCCMLS
jgi:hypothetical protein